MGLFFINYELWNVISELSLNLSANRNMESKRKMGFGLIKNDKNV